MPQPRVRVGPAGRGDEAIGEQVDVEAQMTGQLVVDLLLLGEQIEQQRGEPGEVQDAGDVLVAAAVPARAGAVREDHQAPRVVRDSEQRFEHARLAANLHVLHRDRRVAAGAPGAAAEQRHHLGVANLRELPVPPSDRAELLRRGDAHQLVHLGADLRGGDRGDHRRREDQPARAELADGAERGARGDAGGDAVVHQDHRPACDLRQRHATPVEARAPLQLHALALGDAGQLRGSDREDADGLGVDEGRASLGDGADAQLGLPGRAQLADHQHLERRVESAGDLPRDDDAAAGQRQHQRVLAPVLLQQRGKLPACVLSVAEQHRLLESAIGMPKARGAQPGRPGNARVATGGECPRSTALETPGRASRIAPAERRQPPGSAAPERPVVGTPRTPNVTTRCTNRSAVAIRRSAACALRKQLRLVQMRVMRPVDRLLLGFLFALAVLTAVCVPSPWLLLAAIGAMAARSSCALARSRGCCASRTPSSRCRSSRRW